MIYLGETDIDDNKTIRIALKAIFGVGKHTSLTICKKLGFSNNFKVYELSKFQRYRLIRKVEKSSLIFGSELKKKQSLVLKLFISIKLRRGLRLIKGLPVRGQRTHTNAKSVKSRHKF